VGALINSNLRLDFLNYITYITITMTENEKLSMLSISFKVNSDFEKVWEETIKNNPHIEDGNITVFTPEQLKEAFLNIFIRGAGTGVQQFRAEHKV
jgi:hypothetical protein